MTVRKSATDNGFIIFKDQLSLLKLVSDEQLGQAIKLLLENFDDLPQKENIAYEMFATNVRRYREQAVKSRESGLKGGSPTLKGRDNPTDKGRDNPTVKLQEKKRKEKNKQNNNNIIKEHPNMKEPIERWLEYKKERKESYTKTGLVDCIEKLEKLSNGNPDLAMAIVKQSTSNGWAGLFPLKDNQKAQPQKKEPTVLIADGKFFIDDSMPEYADLVKTMTAYDIEKCWKWIHDNFYGQEKPVSWVRERLHQFNKGVL